MQIIGGTHQGGSFHFHSEKIYLLSTCSIQGKENDLIIFTPKCEYYSVEICGMAFGSSASFYNWSLDNMELSLLSIGGSVIFGDSKVEKISMGSMLLEFRNA